MLNGLEGIKTRTPPVNLALTEKTVRTLLFNHQGQIDVAELDDNTQMILQLGLDPSSRIPLNVLTNANIVFTVAKQLGLEPGKDQEDDQFIIENIKQLISDNVTPETRSRIIKQLIHDWNAICGHEISKKYQFEAQTPGTVFQQHGGYELFFNEYVSIFLNTLTQLQEVHNVSKLFAQVGEITFSTREGRSYSVDPHQRLKNLKHEATKVMKDISGSEKRIKDILERIAQEESTWFVDLETISIAVGNIIEEFQKEKSQKLKEALNNILEGEYDIPSDDDELNTALQEEILPLLKDPTKSKIFKGTSIPIFRYAIHCKIRKTAQDNNFILNPPPDYSIFTLGALDEEALTQKLILEPESFSVSKLRSFLFRAKAGSMLADTVNNLLGLEHASDRKREVKQKENKREKSLESNSSKAVLSKFELAKGKRKREMPSDLDEQEKNELEFAIAASIEETSASKMRKVGF